MILKRKLIMIGGLLLLVALTVIVLRPSHQAKSALATDTNQLFPFVRSLQGTYPDGAAQVTADDSLVADAALRELFDYYLTAIGEKSLAEIRVEIEKELDKQMSPTAAQQAKQVLTRYLNYRTALVAVEKNPQAIGNGVSAIRQRFNAAQQLRSQFFSAAENQAMFGFDDAYDLDALSRLEISQNTNLSAAQKREKMDALDAAMPPEIRAAKEEPRKIIKLEETAEQMRTKGASEDDIYRMRAAALSPEAATRLADLDQDEANWKNRITSYLTDRQRIQQQSAQLPDSQRQALLQQLRDAQFSADEQRRLPAYE
ncbi:MAG: lipase secretion chaperone [Herbaspirillum sp.]